MVNTLRKSIYTALLILAGSASIHAQGVVLDWVNRIGSSDFDFGLAITTDPWGNVYTSGSFNGTVNLGTGTPLTAIGNGDAFLAKYDNAGNFKWAKGFGNYMEDKGWDIKTDPWGNVYITGQFAVSADFNPGGSNGSLNAVNGFNDVFVAKYDSSGNFKWVRSMGGDEDDIAYAMDVDALGNIYITGEFSGTADFNPGGVPFNLISEGGSDIFICKLDSAGQLVWAKSIGSKDYDYGYGIALDRAGHLYCTGIFKDTADFNPGATPSELISAGNWDMYLAKYDTAGNYVWAHRFGSTGDDRGHDVAVSDSGYVHLTGYFESMVNFDPGGGTTNLISNGGTDIFTAKYDGNGALIWAHNIGGSSYDYGQSIAVDKRGNVYLEGYFSSSVMNLDPVTGTKNVNMNGDNDIFIVKLYDNGEFAWGFNFGSTEFDVGYDVHVDGSGNVYSTGYFMETVDFNPGAGTTNLISDGAFDGYVQKMICVDTNSSSVSIEVCENSYTLNGITYNTSGVYEQQFINRAGCDSTLFIHLDLKGNVAKPQITVNGDVLGTTQPYAAYQWLKSGASVPGATNPTYTVTENNDYAVIGFNSEGCPDTSDTYTVTNVGVRDGHIAEAIKIYPNPASGWVQISSPVPVSMTLSSMDGRMLKEVSRQNRISVQDLARGVYLLHIRDMEGRPVKTEKLVRE